MKIIVLVLAVTVVASTRAEHLDSQVTAYLEDNANVPFQVVMLAKGMTSDMFSTIGVRLGWQRSNSIARKAERRVRVELVGGVPAERLPGALAFAAPFDDGRIQVFYNRIAPRGTLSGPLLAHVMAHEIAHVLSGSDDHAMTGIMKADWTPSDYEEMKFRPLSFSHWDSRIIHSGLAMWSANHVQAVEHAHKR